MDAAELTQSRKLLNIQRVSLKSLETAAGTPQQMKKRGTTAGRVHCRKLMICMYLRDVEQ